jgi:hypothetical protein
MHVFICWSGRRSRRLANALAADWLPKVFGTSVTSFVSFANIEKGEGWYDRVVVELERADAAILCLTPENLRSPWLHFESGMMSRLSRGKVFTLFLGADASRIEDPLKQIQVTLTTEADVKQLVLKLADLAGVDRAELESCWPVSWDLLSTTIREVATASIEDLVPGFDSLFERKTFTEPLKNCADEHWLKRYDGARDALLALESQRELVVAAGEPWQIWLYDKLRHQVSAYLDEIKEYLLIERRFEFRADQSIDFGRPEPLRPRPTPRELSALCERRCREIRHGRFCLTRPDVGAPLLPQSLAFAKLSFDQFDDKKEMIHERPWPINRASLGLRNEADLERCARSIWVYDRIMYYKARECEPTSVATMVRLAAQELEKAQAQDEPSLMALHYAVKTLLATMRSGADTAFDAREVEHLVAELQSFLDSAGVENNPKIRRNLTDIRALLSPPASQTLSSSGA